MGAEEEVMKRGTEFLLAAIAVGIVASAYKSAPKVVSVVKSGDGKSEIITFSDGSRIHRKF